MKGCNFSTRVLQVASLQHISCIFETFGRKRVLETVLATTPGHSSESSEICKIELLEPHHGFIDFRGTVYNTVILHETEATNAFDISQPVIGFSSVLRTAPATVIKFENRTE